MVYGLLIAAITILIFIAILDHRIKRRKKYAMQARELISDNQNNSNSSVINETASTECSRQTLPRTKKNAAYGIFTTFTNVAPHFELQENMAYCTLTNSNRGM